METNMSNDEWLELIVKYDVIEKLNSGEKFSSVNIDLGLEPNSDALRKALSRLGFKRDKYQNLYYLEGDTEQYKAIKMLNSVDVEATIEEIASDRYYRALFDDFWGGETVSVEIDKEIYKEYVKLSEKFGCDFENEFMTMVLLEGLQNYNPVNRRREHYIKYINESKDFSKEEVEFIMQKVKEGYDLEGLVIDATDIDILKLTDEELQRYKK